MAKRVVLRVQWNRKVPCWTVTGHEPGGTMLFNRKAHAVARGVDTCRRMVRRGGLAQLVVHGKSGKIQFERTYGRDPRRFPGKR